MIRALLVVALIVFLAELGILFSTGMLRFNLEQPGVSPTNNDAAAVAPPAATPAVPRPEPAPRVEAIPRPTLAPAEPTAAPPPVVVPVSGPVFGPVFDRVSDSDNNEAVAAAPTPTLLPSQIFALYDVGQITVEEANTMLAGLAPQPAATLERGSPRWAIALEEQVQALVNRERQKASLAGLKLDHSLSAIARAHSRDMADNRFFAHQNPAGQSPSQRGLDVGYLCYKDYGSYFTQGLGENIFQAWLYASTTYLDERVIGQDYLSLDELAGQIVAGWMASTDHRGNILSANYDRQGIGVVVSPEERVYVTQNFC